MGSSRKEKCKYIIKREKRDERDYGRGRWISKKIIELEDENDGIGRREDK